MSPFFRVGKKGKRKGNKSVIYGHNTLYKKQIIIHIQKKVARISRYIDSTTPKQRKGSVKMSRGEGGKPVKEITNYYRRRFIEKNWFVLGIAEGDPYRGSLEAPHSGPSLRRIEVYELLTPGFQTRTFAVPWRCIGASTHKRRIHSPVNLDRH